VTVLEDSENRTQDLSHPKVSFEISQVILLMRTTLFPGEVVVVGGWPGPGGGVGAALEPGQAHQRPATYQLRAAAAAAPPRPLSWEGGTRRRRRGGSGTMASVGWGVGGE
jgi:hypothetical protein